MRKFFLYVLLSCVILFGIKRGYRALTDGFSISEIDTNLAFDPQWEAPPLPVEEMTKVTALFDQPFSYLGCGSQSFVFISENGQYLIKFFKQKKLFPSPWLTTIHFPPLLEPYRLKKIQKRSLTFQDTFNSCLIAFHEFRKETGIVFVHLNKTDSLQKSLSLTDKIGRKFSVDLDHFAFVIQKKVEPSAERIRTLMAQKQIETAKAAIASLFQLVAKRRLKGYYDKDPDILRNFGFSGSDPIEFDIGGFVKDPNKPKGYFKNREIIKATRRFKEWIASNYPELLPFTEEQIQILDTLPE
jgi:hypothetical protein